MNESPDPTQPNDDASDPLLTALRQRLGDYGEAPPPGAWAGIRQRLPIPEVARPWWRRPRRLLPLLALLLGLVVAGLLTRQPARPAGSLATSKPTAGQSATTQPTASAMKQSGASVALLDKQHLKANAHSPAATSLPLAAESEPGPPASRLNSPAIAKAKQPYETGSRPTTPPALNQPARQLLHTVKSNPEKAALPPVISRNAPTAASGKARRPAAGALASSSAPQSHPQRPELRAAATPRRAVGRPPAAASGQALHGSGFAAGKVARGAGPLLPRHHPATAQPSTLSAAWAMANRQLPRAAMTKALITVLSQPIDSLQLIPTHWPVVLLANLPIPLAARPDSLRLPYPPVRRWALLALAGPTLSYRTIGPAPATTTSNPDFAHLERPALGLGAQVQVRRALSGRWALAVGVGYQEYATRLALQLADSGGVRIHQRDTYRLLTLPVQLSYALGAPRGRLAKALLLGTEAGWYQGGRSTEGSNCGCQQQAYTAVASPYYPWSLALSLGLDLRYRVGSPASRWQWVVQPTGRYVLTPFVKPNTAGFSQRQPFSLGLLTGFSWSW